MTLTIVAGTMLWSLTLPGADPAADLRSSAASVRARAAASLGLRSDNAAVPTLVAALSDPDKAVRREAAKALAHLHDARATEGLVAALRDGDANVRFYAAFALGEIKSPQTTGALIEALEDPAWIVRDQAACALREIGDRSIVSRLKTLRARPGADRPHLDWLLWHFEPRPAVDPSARLLVGYWSFDDGDTSVAKDVTSRGSDGQVRGCMPVSGKVGQGLRFGDRKYVSLGNPSELPIADTPFTIMAWIKAESPNGVVVARGGAFCGFSLYVKDGTPRFGIHRLQDGPTYIAAGTENIVGSWVHLAGVVDRDHIAVHVNGRLVASAKTAGLIPGNCGQGMEIGFDAGNSAAEITTPFEGVIDEVKMFRAALPDGEIQRQCRQPCATKER